jgi:hypothetical protein
MKPRTVALAAGILGVIYVCHRLAKPTPETTATGPVHGYEGQGYYLRTPNGGLAWYHGAPSYC